MIWLAAPRPPIQVMQFVAEHGNIAAALLRGEGFADPFGTPSGPTAWLPPVFPCYLALVFMVFGVKTVASAWALLALDAAFAGLCVLCTLCALDLSGRPALKPWFAVALVALTWLHEAALGPWLSTSWFVVALDSTVLLAATAAWYTEGSGWWWLLALGCSVASLTHAGSGAACFVLLLALWLLAARRARRDGGIPLRLALLRTLARPAAVAGACAIAVGLWTGRNWIVFHQLIPLKSTGWFEVYLAENYAPDGVLDDGVIVSHHPLCNPRLLVEYTVRGEAAFLAGYRVKAKALVEADPLAFIRHVGGRALCAFSYCDTAPHVYMCRADLSHDDGSKLVGAGLAARLTTPLPVFWTSLDMSPQDLERRLGGLGVRNPRLVERDWMNAKAVRLAGEVRPDRILSGVAMAGLPAACLLGTLLLRRRQTDVFFGLSALFYVAALSPNILITHYNTHQLHFLGLQALFIVSCMGALREVWASRRGRGSP